MNGYSFDPYGQNDSQQNQQLQNAYSELAAAAAAANNNNPCNDTYDPTVDGQAYAAAYGTSYGNQLSFSRFRPNNVTVINHLNFSPTLLTADSFKPPAAAPGAASFADYGLPDSAAAPGVSYPPDAAADLSAVDPFLAFMPSGVLSSGNLTTPPQVVSSSSAPTPPPPVQDQAWLNEIQVTVDAISLEPISGNGVVKRVRECMDDVVNCYIPCVDFLVQCQQDLRKGLNLASQKRRPYGKRYFQDSMTPHQFFSNYIEKLPHQFLMKTERLMDSSQLERAITGLQQLVLDAKKSQSQGSEAVKNSFLGGMKDGESWGLRKWLSRNGNALRVCTELECILNACKKLDRNLDTTRKLAAILRPLAKSTLDRLKSDIPASYQEVSQAHPYLPFFHRLESALRGVSMFDPDDDDVICIDDDDEIEVLKAKAPEKKRKREEIDIGQYDDNEPQAKALRMQAKEPPQYQDDDSSSSGESDTESVIEVVDVKPTFNDNTTTTAVTTTAAWSCPSCMSVCSTDVCCQCGIEKCMAYPPRKPKPFSEVWPVPFNTDVAWASAELMAENILRLAVALERNLIRVPIEGHAGAFWDGVNFPRALRVFASILHSPDCLHFVNPMEESSLIQAGVTPCSQVIKNPLCFKDIVHSLLDKEYDDDESEDIVINTGRLPSRGLAAWNMWRGVDLLQAIDLVFLNSLAYGKVMGEGRSKHRSLINKLRKTLWNGIGTIVAEQVGENADRRRECTPTRRSETSGFVVHKVKER